MSVTNEECCVCDSEEERRGGLTENEMCGEEQDWLIQERRKRCDRR